MIILNKLDLNFVNPLILESKTKGLNQIRLLFLNWSFKIKIFVTVLLVLVSLNSFGQIVYDNVQFIAHPSEGGQILDIKYKADSSRFSGNMSCLVYFNGIQQAKKTDKLYFPKVVNVTLQNLENGRWEGTLDSLPNHSTCLVAVFFDGFGKRDNNNGKGYWTPLYVNNKPIPGALSGVAEMLYSNEYTDRCDFHLKFDLDLERNLYEEDFRRNPEIKRRFTRNYLTTLKYNTDEEKKVFHFELEKYRENIDLDEWELLFIKNIYTRLKDTLSAKECEELIFKNFPQGSWAMQTNSLPMLISIGTSKDAKHQKEIYNDFKRKYTHNTFPDEFTRRVITMRKGEMLSYMVRFFIQDGALDVWTKEVEELQDKELICYAYDASARHLLDYIQSKNNKKDSKPQFTDSPFLMYSLEEPNKMLEIAESLAAKSSRLWRENLNAARRYIDAPYLTNSEVMDLREERLADFLNIQGQSLLLQNKFAEARKILEEAVTRSKQKNALINQNYVEALIKSGNIKASIEAMKVMMSNGKSTESIDKFYAQYTNSTIDSLKIISLNSAKKRLKERLINRDAPDFVFHDVNGREVRSGQFRDKIIVLDFWASWCPPCIQGLKALEEQGKKYENDSSIVFLFLNVEKEMAHALKIINGKTNKSMYGFDTNAASKFQVNGLPSTIIIDNHGKIRFQGTGLKTFNLQELGNEIGAMIELIKEVSNE